MWATPVGAMLVVASLLGCGADEKGAGSSPPGRDAEAPCVESGDPSAGFLPCEVEAVLEAKCQRCHNTLEALEHCLADDSCAAGPFPLLTFADTRRVAGASESGEVLVFERMGEVIASGLMPFQLSTLQPPVERLSDAEKKVLLDWIAACAPSAPSACPP